MPLKLGIRRRYRSWPAGAMGAEWYFSSKFNQNLGSVRKLAGQTLWYGVPTIASRFLGYILSVFLFRWYGPEQTADITQIYAIIPFLNVVYTYGLETAYFRFSTQESEQKLFNTLSISMLVSTVLFSVVLLFFSGQLASWAALSDHPEYFRWMLYILFFDSLSVVPFARLRQQQRPRKYAFIKLFTVLLTLGISYYYLRFCPQAYAANPSDPWLWFYRPEVGIGYYILANAVASAAALLLLLGTWKGFSLQFDVALWQRVLKYSYPLILVGFGGMINEMLSRLIYIHVLDLPLEEEKRQLGIFGASYKVAVLITIFIQVFRMAAEPFFFRQSTESHAPRTYARVMKFFVIACCLMWLAIGLALEPIARLAFGDNYAAYKDGAGIIPVLAMGSVFLGIYYNLSIWYKLTNRTWAGAWITLATAALTAVLNIWWIPLFGYYGSAWATFVCYLAMMLVSYRLGQRYYPVRYAWKKYTAYVVIAVALYAVHTWLAAAWLQVPWQRWVAGLTLYSVFVALIARVERRELGGLPVVGRWFR